MNGIMINRFIGLGISIYGYLKYRNSEYSRNVMILCIVLQVFSLILLVIFLNTANFGKWGE